MLEFNSIPQCGDVSPLSFPRCSLSITWFVIYVQHSGIVNEFAELRREDSAGTRKRNAVVDYQRRLAP